jgi:hypothetical protein
MSLTITKQVTDVSVTNEVVEITIAPEDVVIEVNNLAVPTVVSLTADNVTFDPYGPITAENLQLALEQVANRLNTWIDYTVGFRTTPVFLETIADGDVYQYTYLNETLYRLVPSGSAVDAFYVSFNNGVLSNLVVSKQIEIFLRRQTQTFSPLGSDAFITADGETLKVLEI